MKCGVCGHGELPARSVSAPPWHEVHVDCIGPWMIDLHGGCEYQFNALTSIDPTTNLLEIEELPRKTAQACADAFESGWLVHYPCPTQYIHDQGPEFLGMEFQWLLSQAGIKSVLTSAQNPQGNNIVEAVHKSVGAVLQTLIHLCSPQTHVEAQAVVKQALSTAMHATCCASHGSLLNLSPGAVTFQQDMFLDIPLISDVLTLQEAHQEQVDQCVL